MQRQENNKSEQTSNDEKKIAHLNLVRKIAFEESQAREKRQKEKEALAAAANKKAAEPSASVALAVVPNPAMAQQLLSENDQPAKKEMPTIFPEFFNPPIFAFEFFAINHHSLMGTLSESPRVTSHIDLKSQERRVIFSDYPANITASDSVVAFASFKSRQSGEVTLVNTAAQKTEAAENVVNIGRNFTFLAFLCDGSLWSGHENAIRCHIFTALHKLTMQCITELSIPEIPAQTTFRVALSSQHKLVTTHRDGMRIWKKDASNQFQANHVPLRLALIAVLSENKNEWVVAADIWARMIELFDMEGNSITKLKLPSSHHGCQDLHSLQGMFFLMCTKSFSWDGSSPNRVELYQVKKIQCQYKIGLITNIHYQNNEPAKISILSDQSIYIASQDKGIGCTTVFRDWQENNRRVALGVVGFFKAINHSDPARIVLEYLDEPLEEYITNLQRNRRMSKAP